MTSGGGATEAVRESHNLLRACPMSDARQELLSYRVATTPTITSHVQPMPYAAEKT